MTDIKSKNNLVGTAGEYFVCTELCRRGYLALITPKNNPIYDVVVSNDDGSKSIAIQGKTRSIRNIQGWKFGKDIAETKNNENLYVVLVNLLEDGLPEFYIYQHDVLADRVQKNYENYISKPKGDGGKRKEVSFRWHDIRYFNDDDHARKNEWSPIIEALDNV